MSQVITGHNSELIKALTSEGLLPDNCRRMIIDIDCDNIVKIYYECYGDEKILKIDLPKHLGVVIREAEKEIKSG